MTTIKVDEIYGADIELNTINGQFTCNVNGNIIRARTLNSLRDKVGERKEIITEDAKFAGRTVVFKDHGIPTASWRMGTLTGKMKPAKYSRVLLEAVVSEGERPWLDTSCIRYGDALLAAALNQSEEDIRYADSTLTRLFYSVPTIDLRKV